MEGSIELRVIAGEVNRKIRASMRSTIAAAE
jgi:hypothetical protein